MATDVTEAILQLAQERNISEELAIKIVEDTLLSAYKKKFGSDENAEVRFDDGKRNVSIFARKQIVDGVYNPAVEIELDEARMLNPDAEEGDEILIELAPRDFGRLAIANAKQTATKSIRDIRKDSLYAEYKDKEGEIIIGYYQRERNGTIYVDLGKIEGVLPKKYQSPREIYHVNDRIKALIFKVEKTDTGLSVVLSRTHTDFVRAIFELEVPEIYDKTVEIHKIVREPGYRSKLAVYSARDDVDPVGACVGLKGARIQAIIRELEGEKIDVLKYDPDPQNFIKNALSPAEVREVIILDETKHKALAIVSESQLSLAIGKQGLNVRLANRLVDWDIDVKTYAQFEEMDITSEPRAAASRLFGDNEYEDEISAITELPGVDEAVASLLAQNGIEYIEDFINADDERLAAIEGLSGEQIEALRSLIDELVEVRLDDSEEEPQPNEDPAAVQEMNAPEQSEESEEIEADADSTDASYEDVDDEDELVCPECGVKITTDMTSCPNCGIGLSFEYEE
ncbi:MAG: transcription termination factor NusA [Spirochaetaceae bacterium]|jgi:N utilization substance protein A|nr:transcription termination factor NusA [Spirochaetaceae bacterium]